MGLIVDKLELTIFLIKFPLLSECKYESKMHSDEERRLAHMGQIVLHFFPMILRVILTEVNEINQYACRSIQNNRDFKSKLFEDETSIVLTMINNGYSLFNIQLCYKMLRHFEWINPPRKGWGNEIEDADIELADDIERIRQISNTVILMPLHDVSEIIYSSVIQKVKEISVRIARFKKESNKSEDSIYSCEIGNKETLEEDEILTLLNNLRKMHEIKSKYIVDCMFIQSVYRVNSSCVIWSTV